MKGLITELEKGLGSVVRRTHASSSSTSAVEAEDADDALATILTPADETQYWADVANSAKRRDEREKASAFWNTLEPMAKEFSNVATMQLQGGDHVLYF